MYNLIVSGHPDAWNGNPYRLDLNRFGEYTDGEVIAQFKNLDDAAITKLLSFPTIFAYEQGFNVDARIGLVQTIVLRSGQLRFEYELCRDLPAITMDKLSRLAWELEIEDWELNRTHWAVKDVDLLKVLHNARIISPEQTARFPEHLVSTNRRSGPVQILVTPSVFRIPEQGREEDVVSVMMPFDATFAHVYEFIQGACADVGLRCFRADDIWEDHMVIQDVFNLLMRSRIVIVDFSGRNPNVMYETGIAHTLGREVIPIVQSLNDVPFDLRHHRVLTYLPNGEGLAAMRMALAKRLQAISSRTTAFN